MSEKKGVALPIDIYDSDGNMVRIEFTDSNGKHILDAMWDFSDAQTSENRTYFREWAYNFLANQGWEIQK
jgi:hypothetical protein